MKVPSLEMDKGEVREALNAIRHPLRIAVDRAKNPFNIGSIIRTAHSFLAQEIILIGTEPWYERAAMGMQRYENITEVATEREFLAYVEASGRPLIAFEKDEAQCGLWESAMGEDAILCFGNEDSGLSPGILEAAEEVVAIPMFGINHSYPVAVAAGMAMAEWARRYYAGGRVLYADTSQAVGGGET